MTKSLRSPTASPHWRRMRAEMAWNVPTQRPRLPTFIRSQSSLSTRSRSSPAALLVKVTATMRRGSAPVATRRASR